MMPSPVWMPSAVALTCVYSGTKLGTHTTVWTNPEHTLCALEVKSMGMCLARGRAALEEDGTLTLEPALQESLSAKGVVVHGLSALQQHQFLDVQVSAPLLRKTVIRLRWRGMRDPPDRLEAV